MSNIPGFLLRDSITIEDYAGDGAHGPTYGAPYAAKASVQPSVTLFLDAQGQEAQADVECFVRPTVEPPLESRVTWGARVYRIVGVDPMYGSERPGHVVLRLAKVAT